MAHLSTLRPLLLVSTSLFIGCSSGGGAQDVEPLEDTGQAQVGPQPLTLPTISITFDDGITSDFPGYPFDDWNARILDALRVNDLQAIFFVTGANKLDEKGERLLRSWAMEGHGVANHTWSHPHFHEPALGVAEFERELMRTDSVISKTETYTKHFRFPYLKEGDTEAKVTGFRQVLRKHDYRNGYVTIDASDWYYNDVLVKYLRHYGAGSPKVEQYKAAYIRHILERADYYEALAYDLTRRHIPHTLLLHHNLTSALFLDDLITEFRTRGWALTNAEQAYSDSIYTVEPRIVPAGESLIWSMAKASGRYDDVLRYPAEDSRYERPKLEAAGLLEP